MTVKADAPATVDHEAVIAERKAAEDLAAAEHGKLLEQDRSLAAAHQRDEEKFVETGAEADADAAVASHAALSRHRLFVKRAAKILAEATAAKLSAEHAREAEQAAKNKQIADTLLPRFEDLWKREGLPALEQLLAVLDKGEAMYREADAANRAALRATPDLLRDLRMIQESGYSSNRKALHHIARGYLQRPRLDFIAEVFTR